MALTVGPWVESLLRWIHVAAGILWMGCLISFAFASAHAVKNHDQEKKVVPELTSRALSWSRWGAASTWVTGMLLTALVYYTLDTLVRREVRLETKHGLTADFTLATNEPVIGHATGVMISLAVLAIAFFAYEAVWKALGNHARLAAAGCYLLFVLALYLLSRVFTGRVVFMHAGALLGSTMAMNVWMRSGLQSELIRRSEHNVYMSVPALLAMIATHNVSICDREDGWVMMALVVAACWAATRGLYGKSASAMKAAPSS